MLKEKVKNLLNGNRCLFVMDDVWDHINLENIGLDLQSQSQIKVLKTTRKKELAVKYDVVHEMGLLSPENSWTLFCNHAFPIEHPPPQELIEKAEGTAEIRGRQPLALKPRVKKVAENITIECGRLPLALKTVGRHMAEARSIDEWESTLKHLQAEHLQANAMSNIMKCFRLSYQDLPYYLKTCFVYFSAFPKNTEIDTERLVYAWISEGFVPGRKNAYNLGLSYINQLFNRCLIEGSEFSWDGRVKLCKIHDLLHDLAHSVKQNTWLLKPGGELDKLPEECFNFSRVSLIKSKISKISLMKNNITRIKQAVECPGLRTLLLCDNGKLELNSATFFNNLGYLNVLDLSRTSIRSVPRSIRRLNHLKFLNLSSTKIEMLPKSLSNLRSLIFLDVSNCNNLKWLHQGIGNHKFMLHLNVESTDLKLLPVGISKLVSLEALKGVKFTSRNAANTNALELRHLKGLTRLEQLSIVIDTVPPVGTFGGMENMRILSCRNTSLKTNFIELPEDMDVMKRLEIVRLYKCVVPQWMFRLQTLMELELQVSRDTAGYHYQELRNIPNLRKLHLRFFPVFHGILEKQRRFPN